MAVIITSTTDNADQVAAALRIADPDSEVVVEKKEEAVPATEEAKPDDEGEEAAAAVAAEGTDDEETDDEEEDSAIDPASEAGKALNKHKSRLQKRLSDVLGKLKVEGAGRVAAEAKVSELESQIAAINKRLDGADAAKTTTPATADPGPCPQLENFDSYESYIEALTDWKAEVKAAKLAEDLDRRVEERLNRDKQTEANRARETERGKIIGTYQERVQAFRAAHDDFDQVVADLIAEDIQIPPMLTEHMIHSELGPDVGYYLAKNRKELDRIVKLPSGPMLVALGKIEAKLEASRPAKVISGAKPAPKPVTKAPKPPAKVEGGNVTSAAKLGEPGQSHADFVRMREADLKARGRL